MNARFWIWHNDSMVKITLQPGETIELRSGGATDEGYSWTQEQYTNVNGEHVERHIATIASDCDGRLDHFSEYICPIAELRSEFNDYNGLMMPAWDRESASQRDHSAEAMGY